MPSRLTPPYWNEAQTALSAADPVMARLIERHDGQHLTHLGNPVATLAQSIVSQQISVKAADSIWARVEALLGEITASALLAAEEEALRACGLSRQKVRYLRHAAEAFVSGQIDTAGWAETEDAEVIRVMTRIPGIGRWTTEMFMIFGLLRPDVLPLGDLGLVRAMERLYAEGERLPREQLEVIAVPWRPWRTVATWHLWRSLDPVAVQY